MTPPRSETVSVRSELCCKPSSSTLKRPGAVHHRTKHGLHHTRSTLFPKSCRLSGVNWLTEQVVNRCRRTADSTMSSAVANSWSKSVHFRDAHSMSAAACSMAPTARSSRVRAVSKPLVTQRALGISAPGPGVTRDESAVAHPRQVRPPT